MKTCLVLRIRYYVGYISCRIFEEFCGIKSMCFIGNKTMVILSVNCDLLVVSSSQEITLNVSGFLVDK